MAEYLMHHGIKGQKWGIRRFQNEDGSLTKEGLRQKRVRDHKPEHVKKALEYRNNMSRGKKFAQDMLLGPAGATTYQMARAYGEGRAKAFIRSKLDINLTSLLSQATANAAVTVGNTVTGGRISQPVQRAVATGGAYGMQYALRDEGLSLQQRAMRKKYESKKR